MPVQDIRIGGRQSNAAYQYTLQADTTAELYEWAPKLTAALENDPVLLDIDEHFDGNYLNEETILAAAHAAGYGTASVGKLGPVAIFDAGDKNGTQAIVIDDSTGNVNASGTSIASER